MTISGSTVGRQAIVLFRQAATWGTESTAAGKEIKMRSEGAEYSINKEFVEETNNTFGTDIDEGTQTAALNFVQDAVFDDIRGICFVMGDGNYATVTADNAGKGDYIHILDLAEDNFGDFATIAIKKGAYIHSYQTVKFTGFTMSFNSSPVVGQITFRTIANKMTNESTVITASAFTSLTSEPTGNGGRMYFKNLDLYVNDQSGATLSTTTDLLPVSALEFVVDRNLAADYTTYGQGDEVEEPVEDGYPTISITATLPNMGAASDGFMSDYRAGTAKKLYFEVTGAAASTATGTVSAASFKAECPKAIVSAVDPGIMSAAGRIGASVTFRCLATDTTSDAAGMAFTGPLRVTVINNQSTKQVS